MPRPHIELRFQVKGLVRNDEFGSAEPFLVVYVAEGDDVPFRQV